MLSKREKALMGRKTYIANGGLVGRDDGANGSNKCHGERLRLG